MIKCLEEMLSEGDGIHSKYNTNLQHLGEGASGQVALAENKVNYLILDFVILFFATTFIISLRKLRKR